MKKFSQCFWLLSTMKKIENYSLDFVPSVLSLFSLTEHTLQCGISIEIICGFIAAVMYLQPKVLPVFKHRGGWFCDIEAGLLTSICLLRFKFTFTGKGQAEWTEIPYSSTIHGQSATFLFTYSPEEGIITWLYITELFGFSEINKSHLSPAAATELLPTLLC